MLSYCLNAEKVSKTSNGGIMLLSKFAVGYSEKSKFNKNSKSNWFVKQFRN